MDLERILADLKQERDRLSRAIAALEGAKSTLVAEKTNITTPRSAALKGTERGGLTPEGRRRLSLAMKKRWAERKKKGS
ncbi:MAG: hypothetical protein ABSC63_13120 [Candidatus Binataceae bacterium]